MYTADDLKAHLFTHCQTFFPCLRCHQTYSRLADLKTHDMREHCYSAILEKERAIQERLQEIKVKDEAFAQLTNYCKHLEAENKNLKNLYAQQSHFSKSFFMSLLFKL
jgi:uncharacterized CHY-type Zn-finger protein